MSATFLSGPSRLGAGDRLTESGLGSFVAQMTRASTGGKGGSDILAANKFLQDHLDPGSTFKTSLTYNIPRDVQQKGLYSLDSFATEKNNPATDHNDFANVMSECIMFRLVNCINKGRTCRE